MKQTKRQRRRILLLADFAYASGKAVASGVIRFVSVHSDIDLLVHGRTSEMPMMREGLIPHSGIDGIVTCFGVDMDFMRGLLESIPHVPVVFASVARGVAPTTRNGFANTPPPPSRRWSRTSKAVASARRRRSLR